MQLQSLTEITLSEDEAVEFSRLDLYMSTDHGDSCPETAETIAMMREQTERLSRMVRTLLDMSELKTVPRTDRIQLAPMIEEVLADLSLLAEKSGVTLSQSGEDLWITGSDVLVYRAIFNLVENGVKYNRPGGSVCAAVSRRGEEAMIEIKDTGCGIPEDFRESVFQLFSGWTSLAAGKRAAWDWGCRGSGRSPISTAATFGSGRAAKAARRLS